jgi:hypothetical protein
VDLGVGEAGDLAHLAIGVARRDQDEYPALGRLQLRQALAGLEHVLGPLDGLLDPGRLGGDVGEGEAGSLEAGRDLLTGAAIETSAAVDGPAAALQSQG